MSIYPGLLTIFLACLLVAEGNSAPAATSFSVDVSNGTWSIRSADQRLDNLPLQLNNQSILRGAQKNGNVYHNRIDGLDVSAAFSVMNRKWVQVAVNLHNPTNKQIAVDSLSFLTTPCAGVLNGVKPEDLDIYFEDNIYATGRSKQHDSFYVAAIFAGDGQKSWMMGYRPPQMWTSMFHKTADSIESSVNFWGHKYMVDPNETVTFDPLLISAEFSVLDGFQAFGKFYTPRLPAKRAKEGFGFNTWDFYHGEVASDNVDPALKAFTKWPEKSRMHYFVLDDGWQNSRGNWTINTQKFPEGLNGWVKKVKDVGFEPGVWVSPFWGDKAVIDKLGLTVLEEDPNDVVRYRLDPSCPKVREYVYGQMHDLAKAGVKYFKIDFLCYGYNGVKGYKYSKYAPERVLREFYEGFRRAVGDDAYILGCGTTMSPCAGITDGARIMSDITQNWDVVRLIYHFISYRFWMNGNLYVSDPDFLAIRGPGLSLPGAKNSLTQCLPTSGDRAYEGFTYDQAKTWATMIMMSGGNVTWSDEPTMMSPAAWDMFDVLLKHGGGHLGVPLDLLKTEYPTKWVRREGKRVYVALINADKTPKQVTLTSTDVPELSAANSAQEIFEHKSIGLTNGTISETLAPCASKCYMLEVR